MDSGATAYCKLPLLIGGATVPSSLKITSTSPNWSTTIKVVYQTQKTQIAFNPSPVTGTEANPVQIAGTVQSIAGAAISLTNANTSVNWTGASTSASSGVATNGTFTINVGKLKAGTYNFQVTYPANPPFASSPVASVTVNVTGTPSITTNPTQSAMKAGGPTQSVVLTVKTSLGANCNGSVGFTTGAGDTTTATAATIVGGTGTMNLSAPAGATTGTFPGSLAFTPNAGDVCTAGSGSFTNIVSAP